MFMSLKTHCNYVLLELDRHYLTSWKTCLFIFLHFFRSKNLKNKSILELFKSVLKINMINEGLQKGCLLTKVLINCC